MALGKQQGSAAAAGTLGQYPITTTFAFVVLAALIGLAVLRHLFGSIRLDLGTR